MTLFIEYPALVLIPVCVLFALGWWSRSRLTLTAAGLWAAYLIWEIAVSEDRPDANIRIDLLLIYPVLLVMTLLGLRAGRRALRVPPACGGGTSARKGRAP